MTTRNNPSFRYLVIIGVRKAERIQVDSLAGAFKLVFDHATAGQTKRIRVYDNDPGWWHPVFDSLHPSEGGETSYGRAQGTRTAWKVD